jgi:hypothetical protein
LRSDARRDKCQQTKAEDRGTKAVRSHTLYNSATRSVFETQNADLYSSRTFLTVWSRASDVNGF